jgi:hypothetical protein
VQYLNACNYSIPKVKKGKIADAAFVRCFDYFTGE